MERLYQYDVVIVGGGTAGVSAAVGAAKTGAKTLLIERNAYLGGEATHSGVSTFCGFFTCGKNPVRVVEGVGQLVLDEMGALGPTVDYVDRKLQCQFPARILKMCDGQSVGKRTCGLLFAYIYDQCEGGTWIHCFYSVFR